MLKQDIIIVQCWPMQMDVKVAYAKICHFSRQFLNIKKMCIKFDMWDHCVSILEDDRFCGIPFMGDTAIEKILHPIK